MPNNTTTSYTSYNYSYTHDSYDYDDEPWYNNILDAYNESREEEQDHVEGCSGG